MHSPSVCIGVCSVELLLHCVSRLCDPPLRAVLPSQAVVPALGAVLHLLLQYALLQPQHLCPACCARSALRSTCLYISSFENTCDHPFRPGSFPSLRCRTSKNATFCAPQLRPSASLAYTPVQLLLLAPLLALLFLLRNCYLVYTTGLVPLRS
jgi:hypothetical protein